MKEATLYVSVLALGIGCCASSALAEAQQAATQTDALTADEADLPSLDEVQIDSAEDEAGEESTPADGGAVSDDPPRSLFASARHAVAEINGEVHAFLDRIREIAQTHDPVYADEHRRVYEVRNPEGGTVLRLILERRRTRAGEGADTGGEDDQSALDDWVPDEVAMALDDAQDEALGDGGDGAVDAPSLILRFRVQVRRLDEDDSAFRVMGQGRTVRFDGEARRTGAFMFLRGRLDDPSGDSASRGQIEIRFQGSSDARRVAARVRHASSERTRGSEMLLFREARGRGRLRILREESGSGPMRTALREEFARTAGGLFARAQARVQHDGQRLAIRECVDGVRHLRFRQVRRPDGTTHSLGDRAACRPPR